jgi:murein DD-endopeptidase MepM/ murein hydrolase activator NlpD
VHVVAPGETLTSIARRYRKPVTEIAAANRIAPHTLVKMGDRIVVPGLAPAAAKPVAAKTAAPAAAPAAPQKVATTEPAPGIRMATSAPDTRNETNAAAAEPVGAAPSFRWPVRGRVITAFGAKTNGQQNDGINLAVPEGTAVRAAEDGVVAYAGNELKGYGNLILVRHANGFVTAYAHASEISVKRGDQVRRGQVIAKSGQTGSVTSPQLHFEIRKGSSPVDPMQHLPGA